MPRGRSRAAFVGGVVGVSHNQRSRTGGSQASMEVVRGGWALDQTQRAGRTDPNPQRLCRKAKRPFQAAGSRRALSVVVPTSVGDYCTSAISRIRIRYIMEYL